MMLFYVLLLCCPFFDLVLTTSSEVSDGNLCHGSSCGSQTSCRVRNGKITCPCNTVPRCASECDRDTHCPANKICHRYVCVSPCRNVVCGANAQCQAKSRYGACQCLDGFTGDARQGCILMDPCEPNPCGPNTLCQSDGRKIHCRCMKNFIGSPLTQCRRECEGDQHCASNQVCSNYKCIDPCPGLCGENAKCGVRNHVATCSCPRYFQGDPYVRCFPECTEDLHCPRDKACSQFKCINPCDGHCGINAQCKVRNHKPNCSCPKGFIGQPLTECKRFDPNVLCSPSPCGTNAVCEPGQDNAGNWRAVCSCPDGYIGSPRKHCRRAECMEHSDCPTNRCCTNYYCTNPCDPKPCGVNTDCRPINHEAVCQCLPGYQGDPLLQCSLQPPPYLG